MNMKTFIERHKITADVERADSNPDMEDWTAGVRHFRVTLKMGRKRLTVPFSQGPAVEREPEAAVVLDCLTSDASGYENVLAYEDWCLEYGYDTDSIKALKTFRAVKRNSAKLKRFLGETDYEFLLWQVERL